jgi:hypothetical protein
MKEANRVKYYLVKYFLSVLGVLLGAAALSVLQFENTPKNNSIVFILFSLSLVLFSLQIVVADKIRRVAISKKKLLVFSNGKKKSYAFSQVKDLTFLSFLNMYSLKIKGRSGRIYFLSDSVNTVSMLSPFNSSAVQKRIKMLQK